MGVDFYQTHRDFSAYKSTFGMKMLHVLKGSVLMQVIYSNKVMPVLANPLDGRKHR